jgi:hypothetical protein
MASTLNDNEWVLDGGTTRHFTGNKQLLFDIRKHDQPIKTVTANGYSEYDVVGNAIVSVDGVNIQLKDVAYVPGFNANLISVSKITDTGATVIYDKNKATVTKKGIRFTVPRRNNLYVLTSSAATSLLTAESTSTS